MPVIPPANPDDIGTSPIVKSGHHSFIVSFLVILVSEIGDKTFLIAAVMAMRNPRLLIFSAAMSALFVMTVLSALIGQVLPSILSKQYTQILAAVLFLVFGVRLLKEGMAMTGAEGQEELEEVTQELMQGEKKENKSPTVPQQSLNEHASDGIAGRFAVLQERVKAYATVVMHACLSPVWVQAFVLTFLAEWGDRSQLATVALAGAEDFWWVTIGGLLGHSLCSAVAVIGGRMLAARISVKTVTILGAVLFILFGIHGIYQFIIDNYYDN